MLRFVYESRHRYGVYFNGVCFRINGEPLVIAAKNVEMAEAKFNSLYSLDMNESFHDHRLKD